MGLVVQKFHGNTIASEAGLEAAAGRIREAVRDGDSVVVVVAAPEDGENPYSTKALTGLAREMAGDRPNRREMDLLLSVGETITAVQVTQRLVALGISAIALTGAQAGIATDANFGRARINRVDARRVREQLGDGKVAVVAGFQGVTADGDTTTLGRRGADLTAAALAAALEADALEIYRDLAGVTDADPRLVPDARTLEELDFLELEEMTRQGAHLVLPEAVELASSRGIPVKIRDVAGGRGETLVRPRRPSVEATFEAAEGGDVTIVTRGRPAPPEAGRAATSLVEGDDGHESVITTMTHREGLAQIILLPVGRSAGRNGEIGPSQAESLAVPGAPPPEVRAFGVLGNARINVDLVNITARAVAFTVDETDADHARELLAGAGIEAEVVPGCAKVTLIGAGMVSAPGTLAAVVACLFESGISVLQTADSEITISCLIRAQDLERAIRVLHARFVT